MTDRFDRFSLAGAVVKLAAGGLGAFLLAGAANHGFNLSGEIYHNAEVASMRAVVDGRGSLDGYNYVAGVDPGPIPPLTPVPASDASTAVTADQARLTILIEEGNQTQQSARWLAGGAGALGLVTLRNLYLDSSRCVRHVQNRRR